MYCFHIMYFVSTYNFIEIEYYKKYGLLIIYNSVVSQSGSFNEVLRNTKYLTTFLFNKNRPDISLPNHAYCRVPKLTQLKKRCHLV